MVARFNVGVTTNSAPERMALRAVSGSSTVPAPTLAFSCGAKRTCSITRPASGFVKVNSTFCTPPRSNASVSGTAADRSSRRTIAIRPLSAIASPVRIWLFPSIRHEDTGKQSAWSSSSTSPYRRTISTREARAQAAVDDKRSTSDEACLVRCNEADEVGDLSRCRHPSQRMLIEDTLLGRCPFWLELKPLVDQLSACPPGADRIHPNLFWTKIERHATCQSHQTRLRRGIGEHTVRRHEGVQRGDVDDRTASLYSHHGDGVLGAQPCPFEIDREDALPF